MAAEFIPVGTADAGYIAGLFDGEGHLTISCITGGRRKAERPSYCLKLGFTNCDLAVLSWLQLRIGGHIYSKTAHPRWRQGWELRVYRRKDLEAALSLLEPHVKIKTRQVAIALAFLALDVQRGRTARWNPQDGKQYHTELAATRQAMTQANTRGVPAEGV